MPRIALATCSERPEEFDDDELLLDALKAAGADATFANWHDEADWDSFDRVVVRSPWDYTFRRAEFLRWADGIGSRLDNDPALIAWNSDKTYLADLAAAGLAVIETTYVGPDDPLPRLAGEVVVKPSVSAGARDTGRFGPATHDEAIALIERIQERRATAMVQPYLAEVDSAGETAVVFVDGQPAHALRKGALLAPDEVAPVREGSVGAAVAMYDADLVRRTEATEAEVDVGRAAVAELERRFGSVPLFARVDTLPSASGPILLELEAIEPCLYLHEAPATAQRLAAAVLGRC